MEVRHKPHAERRLGISDRTRSKTDARKREMAKPSNRKMAGPWKIDKRVTGPEQQKMPQKDNDETGKHKERTTNATIQTRP